MKVQLTGLGQAATRTESKSEGSMKAIKKNEKITIADYQYGVDSGFLIVSYSSIKVEE